VFSFPGIFVDFSSFRLAGRVLSHELVGHGPRAVAVSPIGATAGDIYVADAGSNSVSVISPSNTVIATIYVGSYPSWGGLAVVP
jgi:hypothetical protein